MQFVSGANPRGMSTAELSTPVEFEVPLFLAEWLDAEAQRRNVPVGQVISDLIESGIKKNGGFRSKKKARALYRERACG